ncbi:D-alanine--D-alanine ligase family protein [Leucobacter aridicollis]|uniref:D-alanine--D-alanine ligase n=1 Tax=Leucobacter aridicollis TaxID=283878 RepID=A0A852R7Q2_9MICO|nr:D-alanine--D-alanine ligase [Leucobacter aridicollis]MBL3683019.1 D-alanine--D-alanine ligase [Leucobacter aridicollis]NYD26459.1 D-alanine-D-alanine ligase [Leucobacter aridicollis]
MKVAVLFGGTGEERDVSIASAAAVIPALRRSGHQVLPVDTVFGAIAPGDEPRILIREVGENPPADVGLGLVSRGTIPVRIPSEVRDCDVVFLALHGGSGEDGRIQALLDLAEVPYTGSGPLASGLAMDKIVSKTLLRSAGLPTPDWLTDEADAMAVEESLGFPVVVKPSAQGSTVGLTLVREAVDLGNAISEAARYGHVMIEQLIAGRELTVGVFDGMALAVGEVMVDSEEVFSYEAKYQPNAVSEIFPAELPTELAQSIRTAAVQAHDVHRLSGYSRTDFRLDDHGKAWIIETNSLPGLTSTSLFPQSAAAAGLSFDEVCDRICRLAVTRR